MDEELEQQQQKRREALYKAIRALLACQCSEPVFRQTVERLGVPMTAEFDRLIKQHTEGSCSAGFPQFVKASDINNPNFVPLQNPSQQVLDQDEEKFGWKSNESKTYTQDDRPCLGL